MLAILAEPIRAQTDPVQGPSLTISIASNRAQLSWIDLSGKFWVQTTDRLDGVAAWTALELDPVKIGPSNRVEFAIEHGPLFFRLASSLHHVLVVGQSLSVGAYASELLSTNQTYRNLMFVGQPLDGGQPGLPMDDLSALVPLVETWTDSQQTGETIASGLANWIGQYVNPGAQEMLVSNCGRGGSDYALLRREPSGDPEATPTGTYPYIRGLNQVRAARALAGADAYRFEAILAVHGEGDSVNGLYDVDIRNWQLDYEADIQAVTGQTGIIPMFHTQISAWGNLGNANRSASPLLVLAEYERNPLRTILVGPKYFLPYRPQDGLHLTAVGYRWLGEYYAKAYHQHMIEGVPWSPLRPVPGSLTRSNHVVEITFTGQVGPLVLDTNLVTNPQGTILDVSGSPTQGQALIKIGPFGFEYWDTHGTGAPWECSTHVTNVTLVPPDKVRVYLNQAPLGLTRRIRYGYTALPQYLGGLGGPEKGPRGCLRDSDPSPSRYGHPLYNWCVHFEKECP